MRGPPQRLLGASLVVYAIAMGVHFVHNAELIAEYPNMPASWSRLDVYVAWAVASAVGAIGWLSLKRGRELLGLSLLALYAGVGLDSLGHYVLAPWALHTPAMNATIVLEVGAAAAVLALIALQSIAKAGTVIRSRVQHR